MPGVNGLCKPRPGQRAAPASAALQAQGGVRAPVRKGCSSLWNASCTAGHCSKTAARPLVWSWCPCVTAHCQVRRRARSSRPGLLRRQRRQGRTENQLQAGRAQRLLDRPNQLRGVQRVVRWAGVHQDAAVALHHQKGVDLHLRAAASAPVQVAARQRRRPAAPSSQRPLHTGLGCILLTRPERRQRLRAPWKTCRCWKRHRPSAIWTKPPGGPAASQASSRARPAAVPAAAEAPHTARMESAGLTSDVSMFRSSAQNYAHKLPTARQPAPRPSVGFDGVSSHAFSSGWRRLGRLHAHSCARP